MWEAEGETYSRYLTEVLFIYQNSLHPFYDIIKMHACFCFLSYS
jgi:hypothetical protein